MKRLKYLFFNFIIYPFQFIFLRHASHIYFRCKRKEKTSVRRSRPGWKDNIKMNQNVNTWTYFQHAQNRISDGLF
jgi:hypothetical protein